jgi:fatty-acyl-CoA synthase
MAVDWNFADVYEAVAETVPDMPAQLHGSRRQTWREFDRHANALAADLIAAGLGEQSKVAAYTYNCPEYLETYAAAFKAGMVPVNTNYRYSADELVYLFDNADAEAIVFHTAFAPTIEAIRDRLPKVRRWYAVVDEEAGDGPSPPWSVPYAEVVGEGADRPSTPWGRSTEHILMLYTGGTTGMPKGVMWQQGDLWRVLGGGGNAVLGVEAPADLGELQARLDPKHVVLSGCPLMHGTGQFMALMTMATGGAVCTMPERSFDADGMWRTVQDRGVSVAVIVGDAFARPLLASLERAAEAGTPYDLSRLVAIVSSGVMWSHEVKAAMTARIPHTLLVDSYGSSEAVGLGASVSAGGQVSETAKFQLGERVHVFTEDGRRVEPGSEDVGFVAISGALPVGYYKDPEKTESTFRVIDGERYSVPGDYAMVNADGTLHLLGRGSVCINTGGEKVFPEEVEEVLKQHPAVLDAVCVGLPDERFGEVICAVLQPRDGETVDDADVIAFVKERLSSYKAPRAVVVVDSIGRSPAGKVDYGSLRTLARTRLDR